MKKFGLLLTTLISLAFIGNSFGASTGKSTSRSILSLSNDANGIFEDQSGSIALDLNGALVTNGVAKSAAAQQVSIEGTGNNSGITFALVGVGADGKAESEALTGANNGTAKSTRYYKTITSVTPSGAITGDVEGGFLSANGAVSESVIPDLAGFTSLMSILANVTGTLTYTIEHTTDNTPSSVDQTWFDTVGLVAQTVDAESNIVAPVAALRIKITAYTSGSIKLTILQASNR